MFEARSDDSREIIAGLGLDKEPYNKTETISLTPDWTVYELTITTAGFGGDNNQYSLIWARQRVRLRSTM